MPHTSATDTQPAAPARRHDPIPVDPTYAGIYAHGVELAPAQRTLLVSGQVGVAPDGRLDDDFDGQFEQAIHNVLRVLDAADMRATDVVRMTIYLVRAEDIPRAVRLRQRYFDGVRPAITTVLVAQLVRPEWLAEIEVTAAAPPRPGPT